MKVLCKKSYFGFEKDKYYNVIGIYSIFEKDDFITIESNENISESWYRFRLNQSLDYIDDYIGINEAYFYDYFCLIKEERKIKLNQISKLS